jgi:large subunit ribosomal protein L7/L12
MAKLTKDEILKAVEEMTVLELSDLVKALEEKFGVSAAPVAVAAGPAAAADAGEPKEEQTVFNVVLTAAGENKIGAIKAVRELVPTLGLQEAKALVESAPKEVLTAVNKAAAEEAKKKLEAAGAKVELK